MSITMCSGTWPLGGGRPHWPRINSQIQPISIMTLKYPLGRKSTIRQCMWTYCLKTSRRRLFIGLVGLKLLYQGILETPGQLTSSGAPHSSNILFNCSGCNNYKHSISYRCLASNYQNKGPWNRRENTSSICNWVSLYVFTHDFAQQSVCVCVRESERDREREYIFTQCLTLTTTDKRCNFKLHNFNKLLTRLYI